jgi:hypothetical protein
MSSGSWKMTNFITLFSAMRPLPCHQICADTQQEIIEELGIPTLVEKTM